MHGVDRDESTRFPDEEDLTRGTGRSPGKTDLWSTYWRTTVKSPWGSRSTDVWSGEYVLDLGPGQVLSVVFPV